MNTIPPTKTFPALAHIPDPPETLFLRGSLANIRERKIVTIVGSRKPTPYGIAACQTLIAGLSDYPITLISGLAHGIDTIVHETALAYQIPTIAFPGSGLLDHVLYPAENRALAHRILNAGGALLSEYPPETTALPWLFPRRNRILAGIADMVIVVEAAKRSGSLITTAYALGYNKIIGAVPGPIDSSQSEGTNALIRDGAVPILSSTDIIMELNLCS